MAESLPQAHLLFTCGTRWFAVPEERAREVVSVPGLTRVPGAPPHVLGVFSHRGEVMPVVDTGTLFGTGSQRSGRAVVLRLDRGAFALTATQVAGVHRFSGQLPVVGESGMDRHLRGPVDTNGTSVSVMELEGLFDVLMGPGHPK
jgi:purine-binding chemotaxis protein CheW